MPDPSHDTTALAALQSACLIPDEWETEVLARLPDGWLEQAQELGAMLRHREVGSPGALLRGLLAYQLHGYSFRQLGAWSMLLGLADISEAAWRKCLRRAGPWLEWMLTRKLAINACQSPWLIAKGLRRVLLVDGTHLRCLGKKGETWRIHTAFDLQAGRLAEVQVTDCHVGEDWRHFHLQDGDLLVSDSINGYQEHIAQALDKQAQVVVRFSPKTLPLYDEHGKRIDVLSWLKGRHAPAGRITSLNVWLHPNDASQRALRLVALRLTPEQTAASVRRKKRKATQDKRKLQADTLYLAGWLLVVTSLPTEQCNDAEVLALYRARWHIEMLFKRLKQLLRTLRLRCENAEAIKASILLFLLAWTLQEDELVPIRLSLQEMHDELQHPEQGYSYPQPQQGQEHPMSEWMLASVSLDLLRQQVHGQITATRLRECLPQLQRFVRASPRKRTHWYSSVCNWLRVPAVSEG